MTPPTQNDTRTPIRKLRDCLQDLHFLHRLKLDALEELLTVMKKKKYKKGETVFRQGDVGDSFYIVSEGVFSYLVKKGFQQHRVAGLESGDYFGEAALINDSTRAATVTADSDGELYILHAEDFKKTLMANPEIATAIRAHQATRQMSRNAKKA